MPAELLINEGEASMMYVGDVPWHGLGTKLDKPATAAQAIQAAKLDWEVEKRPLSYSNRDGHVIEMPDRYAVVPGQGWMHQSQPTFGIVSKSFVPLQNREAFSFFDPIVGKGAAVYHTAGALGDGERIWILAKLPSQIRVVGDDITDKYLLLSNSHDGHGAVQIKFTPIRVVCNNTLTLALSQGPTIRVTHSRDMHERLKQADRMLGIINERYDALAETFQNMVKVQMIDGLIGHYLAKVFPDPADPADERAAKRVHYERACAEHLYEHGAGVDIPGVRGSLWAAYNGVTEYVDHRAMKTSNDGRLNSIWFGNGYLTKARAFDAATTMLAGASLN
ncbi:MAG: phage/plasmid-like protein (TIGR03299 family) [Candidatus Promineifilaceae bacterium]|jgi:phage/plasmid-like protein (TIGR03299 family)